MPLVVRDLVDTKVEEHKVALGNVTCEGCDRAKVIVFDQVPGEPTPWRERQQTHARCTDTGKEKARPPCFGGNMSTGCRLRHAGGVNYSVIKGRQECSIASISIGLGHESGLYHRDERAGTETRL